MLRSGFLLYLIFFKHMSSCAAVVITTVCQSSFSMSYAWFSLPSNGFCKERGSSLKWMFKRCRDTPLKGWHDGNNVVELYLEKSGIFIFCSKIVSSTNPWTYLVIWLCRNKNPSRGSIGLCDCVSSLRVFFFLLISILIYTEKIKSFLFEWHCRLCLCLRIITHL